MDIGNGERGMYLHESVVRGHHIYKRVWSPIIGEVLELLREEEVNMIGLLCGGVPYEA